MLGRFMQEVVTVIAGLDVVPEDKVRDCGVLGLPEAKRTNKRVDGTLSKSPSA